MVPESISVLWRRRDRYLSWRVLAVWVVLTVLTVAHVVGEVVPGVLVATRPVTEVAVLAVIGTALAVWSRRPGLALAGTLFVALGALSPPMCSPLACEGVPRVHVFVEWTVLGPSLTANHAAAGCLDVCPHRVVLVPLVVGYLLLAVALEGLPSAHSSP